MSTTIHQKCPQELTKKMSKKFTQKEEFSWMFLSTIIHQKCSRELTHFVHGNSPFMSTRILPPPKKHWTIRRWDDLSVDQPYFFLRLLDFNKRASTSTRHLRESLSNCVLHSTQLLKNSFGIWIYSENRWNVEKIAANVTDAHHSQVIEEELMRKIHWKEIFDVKWPIEVKFPVDLNTDYERMMSRFQLLYGQILHTRPK